LWRSLPRFSCRRLRCAAPTTWDEYLASRTTRLRHKLRRAERRLVDNDPPIRVELASTPEQIAEALAAHVRFHQARWESRGYPGAFAEPAVVRFHERATKSELAEHNLRSGDVPGFSQGGADSVANGAYIKSTGHEDSRHFGGVGLVDLLFGQNGF